MRVTHVITRLIVGGAQENTVTSVLGLREKPGIEVDLISGPSTGAEGSLEPVFARRPGLFSVEPSLIRPLHPWKDWIALRRLARRFRGSRPDIVHTHSGKAGILGRLAAAQARVPIIIHTIHGPSFGAFQGVIPNLLFRRAERHAAKVTTHFVVVAEAMAAQYLAAGIGIREQYTRIFSGFELEPFLEARNETGRRASLGIAADDIVVCMIARLFKLKGHDELLAVAPELLRACPQLKFLLVGDGPCRRRFEKRAAQLGIRERFVFTGLVPPAEVAPLLGISNLLVHLSRREGLPRAVPQALAAGIPAVVYDCDGAREVCIEGQTGFLVCPGDLARVRDGILELARRAPLRARLGLAGREFVRARFSADTMVDEIHQLYLRLSERTARSLEAGR